MRPFALGGSRSTSTSAPRSNDSRYAQNEAGDSRPRATADHERTAPRRTAGSYRAAISFRNESAPTSRYSRMVPGPVIFLLCRKDTLARDHILHARPMGRDGRQVEGAPVGAEARADDAEQRRRLGLREPLSIAEVPGVRL